MIGSTAVVFERKDQHVTKEVSFHLHNKDNVNHLWKLVKKYDNFETCVQAALVCNK